MNTFKKYVENKNEKVCIINRGVPGSGKSFTARQTLQKYGIQDPEGHIFSTDDYWTKEVQEEKRKDSNPDEEYYKELEKDTYRKRWNGPELRHAHEWNFQRFCSAVDKGVHPLIVDNTGITASEYKKYVGYAEKAGYKIIIQEPTSSWWNDHRHMLEDKPKYGKQLEDFARFLAGHHQGMSEKYGTQGNEHSVPLDVIRSMIRKWQPNLTADDIMGRGQKS